MGFTGICACSFCRNCMESREHLFFECPFTKIIWGHVIGLCLVADIPVSWKEIFKWGIANLKGRDLELSFGKWFGGIQFIIFGFKEQ